MKILVIEDELSLREALMESLRQEEYLVDGTGDGEVGLDMIRSNMYDLVILDIMLPKLSGLDVLTIVRKLQISVPIILLTALSQLEDKISGMDRGADDYITKPFETEELLARIRMITRRQTHCEIVPDNLLTAGDLVLDTREFKIHCTNTGRDVQLARKELFMLEYLIRNAGQVLTRDQITVRVWGYDSEAEYNNVDVYISYLRKKMLFVGTTTQIVSVRGVGYRLETGDKKR